VDSFLCLRATHLNESPRPKVWYGPALDPRFTHSFASGAVSGVLRSGERAVLFSRCQYSGCGMAPHLRRSKHRSYGPDALQVLNQAFDAAWADIAGFYGDDPSLVQSARNKLADAVLRAADRDGFSDTEALSRAALTMLALSYRPRTAQRRFTVSVLTGNKAIRLLSMTYSGKTYSLHAFEDEKTPGLWKIVMSDPVVDRIATLKEIRLALRLGVNEKARHGGRKIVR